MDEKKQRDWKDKPYTVDERYLFHEFSEDISEDFRTKKGLFKVLWHCKDKAQEMLLKKAKLVEQVLPDLPEHPTGGEEEGLSNGPGLRLVRPRSTQRRPNI